jgi:hypothetical protein
MKGKYLITTDAWFFAPDGRQYKSVWGEVTILEDTLLGVKTNRNSTNWYAKIGSENNHVIVAGCQIHYALKCPFKPQNRDVEDHTTSDSGIVHYKRPTYIYIAE